MRRGLGRGLGRGCNGKLTIPNTAPEMSFGANSTNALWLAWQGQPTSGNIDTLVSGGYLTFTGTVASYVGSGYWQFVISSGAKIVIKQFRKLLYLRVPSACSATWNYKGAMPKSLIWLHLHGNNITWEYAGALPAGLTYLRLDGGNIKWRYNGSLPTNLSGNLYLNGANINWTGWGVQNPFSFGAKILSSSGYYITIGNSPVATEAETAHFLSKIDEKAADCSSNPQTLTFKKTTQITSEEYLPILNSLTSKSYTIVLGS